MASGIWLEHKAEELLPRYQHEMEAFSAKMFVCDVLCHVDVCVRGTQEH